MTKLEGRKAPPFSLPGSDGRMHALEDCAGRMVILFFYPKDDTPGCTKEACGFRDHFAALRERAVVLGVSKDSVASHGRFAAKYRLPFVLLSDEDKTVMSAYGAWGGKMLYGKRVVGVIRSTVLIGPDGVVLRHWPRVAKAADHPNDVLAFLRSM